MMFIREGFSMLHVSGKSLPTLACKYPPIQESIIMLRRRALEECTAKVNRSVQKLTSPRGWIRVLTVARLTQLCMETN